MQYVLLMLLHQNENDLSLDIEGRQVVFRIEIALDY